MVKDIIFGGFSAQPDDYLCPDGELSAAANTIPENGALKTILPSKAVMSLPTGCKFLFIHKGIGYEHYIILWEQPSQKAIYWMDSDSDFMTDAYHLIGYFDTLSHVNAVGNTLIIFDDNGMNYFLWQTGNYSALGNQIPFPEITFGLKGLVVPFSQLGLNGLLDGCEYHKHSETDETSFLLKMTMEGYDDGGMLGTFRPNSNTMKEFLEAKFNKIHKEQCEDKGKFALPFFVRYALRMYDGSLIMHSAPILMTPNSKCPLVKVVDIVPGRDSTEYFLDIYTVISQLVYSVRGSSEYLHKLSSWADIVKSVDVFVSSPIYTFDLSSDEYKLYSTNVYGDNWLTDSYEYSKFVGAMGSRSPLTITASGYSEYSVWNIKDFAGEITELIEFPMKSANRLRNDILLESSQMHYVCSLPYSALELYGSGGLLHLDSIDVPIEEKALSTLEARELMTNDSRSHDLLLPSQSYVYNSRLNISQLSRKLFDGFSPNTMFPRVDYDNISVNMGGIKNDIAYFGTADPTKQTHIKIEVYIKENGNVYKVETESTNKLAHFMHSDNKLYHDTFVFYPNPNAYLMRITDKDSGNTINVSLLQHEFLNGAYGYFSYGEMRRPTNSSPAAPTTQSAIVLMPGNIYTSEINNPFYFPSVGANTIGTGKVLGMCAAVKALSQGQFGQFPMYAFTTEGVWALSVNSHGGFDAIQPVTRDVCINADSITQLDNAVLFAADRGIMLLSGSQTTCISDNLDATTQFNPIAELPHGGHLAELAGLTEDDLHLLPFKEFIKDCRMIYDYTNQRIVVYNTAKENGEKLCKYAYVYSLKTKSWGMMQTTIVDNVNSYPEALALDETNNVLDLSQPDSLHNANGFIVTRPFKLDYDILKTIRSLIVRGVFARGHVKTALYGSNDLLNWFIVSSSTNHIIRNYSGTPYKYFRLVLLTTMNENESAVGFTVEYVQKQTNQIR